MEVVTKETRGYSFDDLIMSQVSSQGCWEEKSKDIILSFFKIPCPWTLDHAVFKGVSMDITAWYTILAVYLLENKFEDKENEWLLIVQKAKRYLKSIAGIEKIDALLTELDFELK